MIIFGDIASPNFEFSEMIRHTIEKVSFYNKQSVLFNLEGLLKDDEEFLSHSKPILFNHSSVLSVFKGFDVRIAAFAKTNHSNWKLVIAGNQGPHTKELYELVERLGITDRVEFLGAVKEIDKVFSQAKIFVLPSRSEGFPNALIEAMANGVASISFDINAGPSDIISDQKNGILVPDGDIKELTNKIKFLINNETERLRISEEGMKIKDSLSVEKIGDIFYDFITKN